MASRARTLVICVRNEGCAASLELRKLYVALPDARAAERDLLRVIDESGEDYLYPEALFVVADLPRTVKRRVMLAA
jgi:hypothetical protein